jgi:ABC-type multidrug transport system ATPase subunit
LKPPQWTIIVQQLFFTIQIDKGDQETLHAVVHRLSKAYGYVWALRDVSLEFRPGECIALLGPNGAGKTTLLKLLSALLFPTQGEITLDGERLHASSPRLRSLVGFLSPHDHVYDGLTASENLRLFVSLYKREKNPAEVEKSLEFVGLKEWSNQYVGSLSSGMKCRLLIAKWFLLEPRLMLLDEPYGVLDGNGVGLLEGYVGNLMSGGGIALIATHHVQRALRLCSRAIILDHGRLIFDEPKQEPWESFHRAFENFAPREERWNY